MMCFFRKKKGEKDDMDWLDILILLDLLEDDDD